MLVYRVFGHLAGATAGVSGHPMYVYPRQTRGRWDNFSEYRIVYVAASPEGAIAETFGRIPEWSDGMFDVPYLAGGRYALATFSIPDDTPLLDLDDARTLVNLGLRPTQVVTQNSSFTQDVALQIFRELKSDGSRRWAGIRWWSFWRPQWPVMAVWMVPGEASPLTLQDVQALSTAHVAVRDAAKSLVREFIS